MFSWFLEIWLRGIKWNLYVYSVQIFQIVNFPMTGRPIWPRFARGVFDATNQIPNNDWVKGEGHWTHNVDKYVLKKGNVATFFFF